MALFKKKWSDLPSDAVVLTEAEAISYQMKLLKKWKDPSDVFALRYGSGILAGASVLSGIFINNLYRTKLRLYNYGRVASYLPVCALPAAFSVLLHTEFVFKDIIIQKTNCPVCVELRASALQATIGTIFPLILAPAAGFSLAIRYTTYDIPSFTKQPLKVLQLIKKITNPVRNILFGVFVTHALLASAVTFFEVNSVLNVNRKLAKLEYELEHSVDTPA